MGGLVIGLLGGGQLARMTALSAYELGLRVAVLERTAGSPAGLTATHEIVGDWRDPAALGRLAEVSDVVTLENEFVAPEALTAIEALGRPVLPSARTIALIRDKLDQKRLLDAAGLAVTPFAPVATPQALRAFGERHGWPVVLKARRLGYDGRGNLTVAGPEGAAAAFDRLAGGAVDEGAGLFAEAWVAFERELAVMVTRGRDGSLATYPVVETVQREHICHSVVAPAAIPAEQAARARWLAERAAEAVGHVGVMGVELFQTRAGEILINELAPRPHNSGHYTIEAGVTSQFENHLRAVLGWPLGRTELRRPAAMVNLLGDRDADAEPTGIEAALAEPDVHVHIYGKAAVRRGRKMGHVTALADTPGAALALARCAAGKIRL